MNKDPKMVNFEVPDGKVPVIYFGGFGFTVSFHPNLPGERPNEMVIASLPQVEADSAEEAFEIMKALVAENPPPPEVVLHFENDRVLKLMIDQLIYLYHEMIGAHDDIKEERGGDEEPPDPSGYTM
jgi:hypothetical protein